jgi:hypothetical protein
MKGSRVSNTDLEEQPPEYGPQYEDHQLIDAVELHVVRQPPTIVTTYFCRTSSTSIAEAYATCKEVSEKTYSRQFGE